MHYPFYSRQGNFHLLLLHKISPSRLPRALLYSPLVRTSRRIVFRLLAWNPWQAIFLRGFDHLRAPMRS